MRGLPIRRKSGAGNIVAGELLRVGRQDHPKLGMPVGPRHRIDHRNRQVMDHPAFVPPAFVVDDEQAGNIGEDVDEGIRIVRIRWQPRLGLQHEAHGSHCRQSTVAAGYAQLSMVVDPRENLREYIGLKAAGI
jgi:hypothetical protein